MLAFRFTATVTGRAGTSPLERLESPERLRLWLEAAGLAPRCDVTDQELAQPVPDALAVIAADAVETIGACDRQRIKACEGRDCQGLYLDTSRGNNRRWCSMNTCGNRAKKARMSAR